MQNYAKKFVKYERKCLHLFRESFRSLGNLDGGAGVMGRTTFSYEIFTRYLLSITSL